MSRTFRPRVPALLFILSTAIAGASAQSAPRMRQTTAPFVGTVLDVEVEGAVPNSPIELYFSPQAGSTPTPFGVLELRSDRLRRLAIGVTDAAGGWTFGLPIPLDPAYAEMGAHFQALVDDPSAPAGRIYSEAVHARFLGPRVYAGYRGKVAPYRIGMHILSAVTDQAVTRVDYGHSDNWIANRHDGKPVFDAVYSRGAVMSTDRELVIFDPYFGGILSRIPFTAPCSRVLQTDEAGRAAFVLELAQGATPARVHAIDLETRTETGSLDLPNAVEAIWCGNKAGSEAFIAEHDLDGRTAIRWVGLDPLVDRGSVRVGKAGENFVGPVADWQSWYRMPITFASGQVFVSTGATSSTYPYVSGSLTRCRPTPSGIGTRVSNNYVDILTPALQADRLLASAASFFVAGLWEMPLSSLGHPVPVPAPPQLSMLYVHELEVDQNVAWVLGNWEWDHPENLYRVDLDTNVWSPPLGAGFRPVDMEVLRDPWNHELWITQRLPGFSPPGIRILDELHGTERHIALNPVPEVLHAVPLP